jgi:hypothetical protein
MLNLQFTVDGFWPGGAWFIAAAIIDQLLSFCIMRVYKSFLEHREATVQQAVSIEMSVVGSWFPLKALVWNRKPQLPRMNSSHNQRAKKPQNDFMNSFHFRRGWKYYASCPLRTILFTIWLARNARAHASARSIGFCVIWVYICSSSKPSAEFILNPLCLPLVSMLWTKATHESVGSFPLSYAGNLLQYREIKLTLWMDRSSRKTEAISKIRTICFPCVGLSVCLFLSLSPRGHAKWLPV